MTLILDPSRANMTSDSVDSLMMPPPRKVLRRGSPELKTALKTGEVELSLPQPELNAWLRAEQETIPTHESRPTQNMNVRGKDPPMIQNMEEDWNKKDGIFKQTNAQSIYIDESESSNSLERDEASVSSSQSNAGPSHSAHSATLLSDVVGHAAVKLRIEEVLLPISLPSELADSVLTGIRSFSPSILLHGPPGCGKTKLAKAIAGEAQAAFLSVGPSDILSKFVGESEATVRNLFNQAYDMAYDVDSRCTVLFFDEIDALGQSRGTCGTPATQQSNGGDSCSRRVLAELLIQLNRLNSSDGEGLRGEGRYDGDNDSCFDHAYCSTMDDANQLDSGGGGVPEKDEARLIVVAATNRPEDCDPALIRRFGIRVLVGPPSKRDRRKILELHLKGIDHNITKDQIEFLAKRTAGWTGSDLEALSREAAMAPIRQCIRSAALIKKRARKTLRADRVDQSIQADPNEEARHHLRNRFQNLRPVSLADFNAAISFSQQQHYSSFSRGGIDGEGGSRVHYDSSSDEDD